MDIRRILLDAGHGPNNEEPGAVDPGASADGWTEHEIADGICDGLQAVAPLLELDVVRIPELTRAGVAAWANDIYRPGDFVLSIHLNAFNLPAANGTEIVFSRTAPAVRAAQAYTLGRILSQRLGTIFRKTLYDDQTPQGSKTGRDGKPQGLTILRRTKAPAMLLEMGFITNPSDSRLVRLRGVSALAEAIDVLRGGSDGV